VREQVPQSEPWRVTPARARSSELGIPVASRGGTIGSINNTLERVRSETGRRFARKFTRSTLRDCQRLRLSGQHVKESITHHLNAVARTIETLF
jgi:hypothetical protein